MTENDDKILETLLDIFVEDTAGNEGGCRMAKEDEPSARTKAAEEEQSAENILFVQAVDAACNAKHVCNEDVDEAWKNFCTRTRKTGKKWRVWIGAAAAILILFAMTFRDKDAGSLNTPAEAESKSEMMQHTVEETTDTSPSAKPDYARTLVARTVEGEMKTITLPDGTEVTLNARSQLSYPEKFNGKERTATLRGEAYFKVARDAERPFILRSGTFSTRVLGTEFNIRGYEGKEAHVTLVSGKVEVTTSSKRIIMKPNQDLCLDGPKITVTEVNTKDYTSWRHGIFYFDNATLETILQQIGNWYGTNVVCRDEKLLGKRYHIMFHNTDSLEDVLDLLKQTSEVETRCSGNTVYIE